MAAADVAHLFCGVGGSSLAWSSPDVDGCSAGRLRNRGIDRGLRHWQRRQGSKLSRLGEQDERETGTDSVIDK